MPIRDVAAELAAAAALVDEAWDLASQAKEKAAEARVTLMGVAGSTPPATLGEAIDHCINAHELIERGQENCTGAQTKIGEYLERING